MRLLIGLLLLTCVSGCHCWGWGDCYSDKIDCIADRPLCLDHLYHPGLDVTRICIPDPGDACCQCQQCRSRCRH